MRLAAAAATAALATSVVAAPTPIVQPTGPTLQASDLKPVHATRGRHHRRLRGGTKPTRGRVNRHGGYRWCRWAGDITIPGNRDRGNRVRAWRRGRVIDVTRLRYSYGKHIEIRHGRGKVTLYAHLRRISVRDGERVRRGEIIGRVGSTGNSTGPHLHFEIRP